MSGGKHDVYAAGSAEDWSDCRVRGIAVNSELIVVDGVEEGKGEG